MLAIKKKIFAITVICIFILLSLATLPSSGLKKTEEEKDFWALLVAPPDNLFDFVSGARYIKDILISGGWSEDHIITLFYENATKENLIAAINQIAENDTQSDTTLVYLEDHGGRCFSLYDSYICYDELDGELDKLDSAAVAVVISACNSGNAIPYLQKDGRVIVTSSRHNETAGYFSQGFIAGLIGFADKKTETGDNNEMVSMEEAFYYCMDEYDWPTYKPQIQDNYTGQLNLIYLDAGYDKMDQFPNYTMMHNNSEIIGGNEHGFKYQAAQSFKPTFNVLTKVRLHITAYFRWTDPDIVYPLNISIRKNLTGEDLTSVSISPSKVVEYEGYHTFDFPDIQVTPDDTYYIVANVSSDVTELQYSWRGREDECYSNGKSYYSSDYGKTWREPPSGVTDLFFVTYGYDLDNNPPTVKITKPEKALYLFNFKIRKYLIRQPLIVGKINITVDAKDDDSGINRVEFYIDEEFMGNDTTEPYNFIWNERAILKHKHTIKAIAYDNEGNSASNEILVRKFF